MTDRSQAFLREVLGEDGAKALARAVERRADLETVLVPRAALAWLRANPTFRGDLPGGAEYIDFAKTEVGYEGSLAYGCELDRFHEASIFRVAAAVLIALDADGGLATAEPGLAASVRDLGKSLDALAKVSPPGKYHDLPEKLKTRGYSADSAFAIAWAKRNRSKKSEAEPEDEEKLEKEGTGVAAEAKAPEAPKAPTKAPAPSAAATKAPRIPKVPTVKLSRSEGAAACPECGGAQLRGDEFVGCPCFSALAKNAEITSVALDHVVLRLNGWDGAAVVTFLETVGRV